MSLLQRVRDWRRERYIRRLRVGLGTAMCKRDRILARLYWGLMIDAVNNRSAAQVARMERRMGLL
jgi:hypothetical protein